MKKVLMMALAALAAGGVWADTWTDPETGITWTYKVSNGKASVGIGAGYSPAIPTSTVGVVTIPSAFCGYPVTSIGDHAFEDCNLLTSVTIPNGVTSIGAASFRNCSSLENVLIPNTVEVIWIYAFEDCSRLKSITIPGSVTTIYKYSFGNCRSLKRVEFKGAPPYIEPGSGCILDYGAPTFPREYGAEWQKLLSSQSKLGGFIQPNRPIVEYVSVKVRENDPTIIDCVYRVKSGKPIVKVRALAFKDGGRSFANVVRPETFIEGTAQNVGDAVAANVEHKLSWQVSADWGIDLAKVSFEVLATEDQLLPLELRTIPANGSNKAMEFSWNEITSEQVFSALLWQYADKDIRLKLVDGALFELSTRKMLAFGSGCSGGYITNPPQGVKDYLGTSSTVISYSGTDAIKVVFSKMGFSLLTGSNLTYVNTMSRLGLSPNGALQYAYRWIEK